MGAIGFTDVLLLVMATAPFLGAAGAAFLPTRARNAAATLALTASLSGLACALLLHPAVVGDGVVRHEIAWLPSLGVNLVLRLDGLSWLFAVLVLGVGALVTVYARYYMSPEDPVPRFFSLLLAFMGAMLGVVVSGNLIQLVAAWELTSLFSFLLIGYWHGNPRARDGARMALTVTASGGLCLLVGAVLLGRIAGSYDLDVVLASGDAVRASPLYLPALLLILVGAFTKSAQFPFHFWLPQAMAAPTPVSAYLHSATMVKAGVFLLIRLWPVLAGMDAFHFIVAGAGVATLLLGAYSAVFQHDLKGVLAYSTISHLGLITLLIGLNTELGLVAAIFHTLNHAIFKASLFMAAGVIDHETGSRDLRKLSGLFRFMPYTATLAMVAAAAMAGVPLLNGFLSKEMFLAATAADTGPSLFDRTLPAPATLASAFTVLYSLRFIHQTFFGPEPRGLGRTPHEPPRWMRFPIELLVVLCVLVGVIPALTIGPFLADAVSAVLGTDAPQYSLAVWHGFSWPLMLSLLALGGGAVLYRLFGRRINDNPRGGPWLLRHVDGAGLFQTGMTRLVRSARTLEAALGPRQLQPQLRILLIVACLFCVLPLLGRGLTLSLPEGQAVDPAFALLWLAGGGCAIAAASLAKYQRLASVVLLGGAGLVSCITFVRLSAPDLAITQLLVEAVTTVLLLLGLRWLPKREKALADLPGAAARRHRRRLADLLIAGAAGLGLALLAYAVMTRPAPAGISDFFLQRAYPDAGGRNVVNVLLVDFRAFDTLGEITVLGLVGLSIFALLRRFRPAGDTLGAPTQQQVQNASDDRRPDRTVGDTLGHTMLIPRVVMQWLFPFVILFAAHLFLRGHDAPGGGFAAGIALSAGFILQYMASDVRQVEDRLRIRPVVWIGLGLLVACLTGAGSFLFGYAFLTSWFTYLDIPVIGRTPAPTALLFDLGVFILVLGATVLALIALAHQSLRRPRRPRPDTPGPVVKDQAVPIPAGDF